MSGQMCFLLLSRKEKSLNAQTEKEKRVEVCFHKINPS